MRNVGWINWEAIYDDLPARFAARDVAAISGVGPMSPASPSSEAPRSDRRDGPVGRVP